MTTIMIFSIIQGMYVLNGREEDELNENAQENDRQRRTRKRRNS